MFLFARSHGFCTVLIALPLLCLACFNAWLDVRRSWFQVERSSAFDDNFFSLRFARTHWAIGPSCISQSGELDIYNSPVTRKHVLKIADGGGQTDLHVHLHTMQAPLQAVKLDSSLFITRWTCENNFHHFIEQTYIPLFSMAFGLGITSGENMSHIAGDLRVHGCPDTHEALLFGRHANALAMDDCHGDRFTPFSSSPVLPFSRTSNDKCLKAEVMQCYTATYIQNDQPGALGLSSSAKKKKDGEGLRKTERALNHLVATNCPHAEFSSNVINVIIIQRRRDRIIVNLVSIVHVIKAMNMTTEVVYFEDLNTVDQLRKICSAQIVVGVHGQGLAWSQFLGLSEHRASRAFVIELSFAGWGCWYRNFVGTPLRHVVCQGDHLAVVNISRAHMRWSSHHGDMPFNVTNDDCQKLITKLSDVQIVIPQFQVVITKAQKWVTSGSTDVKQTT